MTAEETPNINPAVMSVDEHNTVAQLPTVLVNRFYATLYKSGNIKVTFVEQEENTKAIFPRASVLLAPDGVVQLINTLQQAYMAMTGMQMATQDNVVPLKPAPDLEQ